MCRPTLTAVFLLALWTPTQSQNTPASLNLNQTWVAPFPASNATSATTSKTIEADWNVVNNYFFGADTNVAFVKDPFNASASTQVLQVFYAQGSFTPSSSAQSSVSGGTEFYMQPFGDQAFNKALLSYDIAFANNFQWNQGGKLPGFFGGKKETGSASETIC
jgi:hypothetical protein